MNEAGLSIPPTKGAARVSDLAASRLIAYFEDTGYSAHSPQRASLQIVLDHCQDHGIPCEVTNAGGRYFVVKRLSRAVVRQYDPSDGAQEEIDRLLRSHELFRAIYIPGAGVAVELVLRAG